MSDSSQPQRFDCFVTSIWRFPDAGEIDRDKLLAAIHREREEDPRGKELSNIGGWQSENRLYEKPEFRELANAIMNKGAAALADWGFDFGGHPPALNSLWANVNRGSDFNEWHHHLGFAMERFNLLSGAYYVKCSPNSGPIKFVDERASSKFITNPSLPFVARPTNSIGGTFGIRPRPGDLLLFPAWLEHKVDSSEGEDERISVSFNLSIPDELVQKMHDAQRENRDIFRP